MKPRFSARTLPALAAADKRASAAHCEAPGAHAFGAAATLEICAARS
jgi:hypothetical protein